MNYTVKLTITVATNNVHEAYDIGVGAAEHLLDTFNDTGNISPYVNIEVESEKVH